MKIEFVGILATIFIVLSFVFQKENQIRTINIVGCILFVVYGVIIGAFSTWLSNGILILIHSYYLWKGRD